MNLYHHLFLRSRHRNRIFLFGFLLVFFLISHGLADQTSVDTEEIEPISAAKTKMMLDKDLAVVINVLSQIEYDIQHIPGSINIPVQEILTTEKLPEDKKIPLIFYCMGKT